MCGCTRRDRPRYTLARMPMARVTIRRLPRSPRTRSACRTSRSKYATVIRPKARRLATAPTAVAAWQSAAWPCAPPPSKSWPRRRRSPRTCWKRRPTMSCSIKAVSTSRATLAMPKRWARWRLLPSAPACPRASITASKRLATSIRPILSGRSGRTSVSSKSTRRSRPEDGRRRSAAIHRRRRLRQCH